MPHSRRAFLKVSGLSGMAGLRGVAGMHAVGATEITSGQLPARPQLRHVETDTLSIAYEEHGRADGVPIILLHGFPDDVRAFDDVAPPLAAAGHRVLVPYLRGYGPTRFLSPSSPRMAQQSAIGQDLVDFADALKLPPYVVCGYDWGGRAAGIAAALHPDRVRAAVLIGGYTIQNTVTPSRPASPQAEYALWYQWYFNTERGRAGLAANRRPFCRLLWELWSPTWKFSTDTYERTADSFDNPDFVDVVIHSYRHRNHNAPGEPRFAEMEKQLVQRPVIKPPAIVLLGADDGIARPAATVSPAERALFASLVDRRVVAGAGHFVPREKPGPVSSAILELLATAR